MVLAQVRIPLDHLQGLVAGQFRDRLEVFALDGQVRAEVMSQGMEGELVPAVIKSIVNVPSRPAIKNFPRFVSRRGLVKTNEPFFSERSLSKRS